MRASLSLLGLFLAAAFVRCHAQVTPTYFTPPFTPGISHRQSICDRYTEYRNSNDTTYALRHALKGMALRPIITSWGEEDLRFHYSPDTGIDPEYPGILVEILDELAERAGFTWKDSFAVMTFPPPENVTISEMLEWGVGTYDIAIDWFTRTPERVERGISFMVPWLDGSLILIGKENPPTEYSLTNFMKPFEASVWVLILFTVFLSAFVYQFIEYLQGEQENRSLWQWTSDNLYLSAINFSQNFEYSSTTSAGRIFAVSMTLWALLITATYTANLASLLVEANQGGERVESIEQAIALQKTICTWAGTAAGEFVATYYPEAKTISFEDELEAYQGLQEGKCAVYVGYKDPWFAHKNDERYNPDCDMEWMGRAVRELSSGFAVKADVGHMCSSFIPTVLNLHMLELKNDGFLDTFKTRFQQKFSEEHQSTCGGGGEDENGRVRMLLTSPFQHLSSAGPSDSRQLKSGGGGSAAKASGGDDDASSLTLQQMLGTFVMHWGLMAIAILVSAATTVYYKYWPELAEDPTESSIAKNQVPGLVHTGSKCQACGACNRIDWEAKYAQLSNREKAVVDVLFQLDGNTLGDESAAYTVKSIYAGDLPSSPSYEVMMRKDDV